MTTRRALTTSDLVKNDTYSFRHRAISAMRYAHEKGVRKADIIGRRWRQYFKVGRFSRAPPLPWAPFYFMRHGNFPIYTLVNTGLFAFELL